MLGAALPRARRKSHETERSADVLLPQRWRCVWPDFYTFNTPLGPSIGSDNAMYRPWHGAGKATRRIRRFLTTRGRCSTCSRCPSSFGGYSTLAVFIQQVIALFLCLRVVSRIARTWRTAA
ncbi:MAG: hypothetical protein ACLS7Z_10190 [Christensenellales bacterium]